METSGRELRCGIELTYRERSVLQLVCEGRSRKAIARLAGITEHTVKWYIGKLSKKLGAANRIQLVGLAVYLGLATPKQFTSSRPADLIPLRHMGMQATQ